MEPGSVRTMLRLRLVLQPQRGVRVPARQLSRKYAPPLDTEPLRALLRKTAQPVAVVTCKNADGAPQFHGATISSFTSVAMQPMPLVTFSMRTPSRLVRCLEQQGSLFAVNLLAAHQAHIAESFARPDLHPDPWSTLNYGLNADGIPVFSGVLGSLNCTVEGNMLLGEDAEGPSMLFIARVDRVEHGHETALPLVYHQRGYTTVQGQEAAASPYNKP